MLLEFQNLNQCGAIDHVARDKALTFQHGEITVNVHTVKVRKKLAFDPDRTVFEAAAFVGQGPEPGECEPDQRLESPENLVLKEPRLDVSRSQEALPGSPAIPTLMSARYSQ